MGAYTSCINSYGEQEAYERGYADGRAEGTQIVRQRLKGKRQALQAKLKGLAENTTKTKAELAAVNIAMEAM